MKIIAFEGLDKSGKHSMSEKVYELLKDKGYSVKKLEFPNYESYTGKLIRGWLTDTGPAADLSLEAFEILQSADKLSMQGYIENLDHDYLIIDRYIHSQYAYAQDVLERHLKKEVASLMAQPDCVVYMDVSPETSQSRKGQHGDNDKYESDLEFLSELHGYYADAFKMMPPNMLIHIDAEQPLDEVLEQASIIVERVTA